MSLYSPSFSELFDVVESGDVNRAKELLESIEDIAGAVNRLYRGPHTLLHK